MYLHCPGRHEVALCPQAVLVLNYEFQVGLITFDFMPDSGLTQFVGVLVVFLTLNEDGLGFMKFQLIV